MAAMTAEQTAREFLEQFHQVFQRFHRRESPHAYRPSRETLGVLQHLEQSGPMTVSEACNHFDRSQAAMSEIFQRMESRGLIERMSDERDRRRTLVWLTDTGKETTLRARQVLSIPLLTRAFEQLDEETRQAVLDGMVRLLSTNPQPPGDSHGSL